MMCFKKNQKEASAYYINQKGEKVSNSFPTSMIDVLKGCIGEICTSQPFALRIEQGVDENTDLDIILDDTLYQYTPNFGREDINAFWSTLNAAAIESIKESKVDNWKAEKFAFEAYLLPFILQVINHQVPSYIFSDKAIKEIEKIELDETITKEDKTRLLDDLMFWGLHNMFWYSGTKKKYHANDICPCGSGMKYKKCHGKFA